MFDQVKDAAARLHGYAHRTPVMTSHTLDERAGAQVFLKCENFQRMGAFKFRGAYNAISQLSDEHKARGVITYSSGNHAQAVALVCRMLGVQAVVVMPDNAWKPSAPPRRLRRDGHRLQPRRTGSRGTGAAAGPGLPHPTL
jgi:threonine dehydratase